MSQAFARARWSPIRFRLATSGARTRVYVVFNFGIATWSLRIF